MILLLSNMPYHVHVVEVVFYFFVSNTICTCSEQSMFGKANYMSPLDVQQYLYCLTPRSEVCANPRLLKGITNIGKLDIVWKKNMGEKGRLQTSALQRVVCIHDYTPTWILH